MNTLRFVLAGLLLLVTLQGAGYFLFVCHLPVGQWLMFNACAVANLTYLVGVILFMVFKTKTVMYMAILPLFFFGTGGLFVFPWHGPNLIAQVSHLLMTANLLLMLFELFKSRDFFAGTLGLLLGTLIFTWFVVLQQHYTRNHIGAFMRAMGASAQDFSGTRGFFMPKGE